MHGQGNYQDEKIHPANNGTIIVSSEQQQQQQQHLSYGSFPTDGRSLPTTIFLDSGGVINDNDVRAPQWVKNLSYVMPRIFGGPAKHWGESNRRFSEKVFEISYWNNFVARFHAFEDFDRAYNLLWLEMMAETMDELLLQDRLTQWQRTGGIHHQEQATRITSSAQDRRTLAPPSLADAHRVFEELIRAVAAGESMAPMEAEIEHISHVTLPASEDDRVALAKALNDFCVGLVKADYPGARDAILRMRVEQGLTIYTCSNEVSSDLEATFKAINLLSLSNGDPVFAELYGPDLVNQMKNGPKYYARIFEECQVDPFQSVVVDDKELMLSWAKPLGVTTVQVNKKRSATPMMVDMKDRDGVDRKVPAVDFHITSLAQLPDLLEAWKESFAKK